MGFASLFEIFICARKESVINFLPGAVLFRVQQLNHHCRYKPAQNYLEQVKQEVTHTRILLQGDYAHASFLPQIRQAFNQH